MKEECLRFQMNSWFSHGQVDAAALKSCADLCCSNCMLKCSQSTGCSACLRKLKLFAKDQSFAYDSLAGKMLTSFLRSINLNEERDESNLLNEENLAKEMLLNLTDANEIEEFKEFLSIFSLNTEQVKQITNFVESKLQLLSKEYSNNFNPTVMEEQENTSDSDRSENISVDDEYFDSDEGV